VASSAATLLALHLYQERVAEWAVSLVLSLVVLVACEIEEAGSVEEVDLRSVVGE